jgi:hypothetical protein
MSSGTFGFLFQATYNTLLRARTKYGSLYEVQQSLAIYLEMRKAGYGNKIRDSINWTILGSLFSHVSPKIFLHNVYYYSYSSDDYYLKVLLEEWCEGVLCSQTRDDSSALLLKKKTEEQKPYYLFFEKVATQLQKDIEHDRVIDVRGLSKVLLSHAQTFRFFLQFLIVDVIQELTLFAIYVLIG